MMENFYENFMLAFWRETVTAVYRRILDDFAHLYSFRQASVSR